MNGNLRWSRAARGHAPRHLARCRVTVLEEGAPLVLDVRWLPVVADEREFLIQVHRLPDPATVESAPRTLCCCSVDLDRRWSAYHTHGTSMHHEHGTRMPPPPRVHAPSSFSRRAAPRPAARPPPPRPSTFGGPATSRSPVSWTKHFHTKVQRFEDRWLMRMLRKVSQIARNDRGWRAFTFSCGVFVASRRASAQRFD